jgi:hypothetical protein
MTAGKQLFVKGFCIQSENDWSSLERQTDRQTDSEETSRKKEAKGQK